MPGNQRARSHGDHNNGRLREWRESLGWSEQQASNELRDRFGIAMSKSTIHKLETGVHRLRIEQQRALCRLYDCTVDQLLAGPDAPGRPAARPPSPQTDAVPVPMFPADSPTLPMFHTKVVGPGGLMEVTDEGDPVERPRGLDGVETAYALRITTDVMAPRYFPGELVHVDPSAYPEPGERCFVAVRMRDGRIFVKRLVGLSETVVILEQYNPHATDQLLRKKVLAIHLVIPRDH